jgi:hypothetical protein
VVADDWIGSFATVSMFWMSPRTSTLVWRFGS